MAADINHSSTPNLHIAHFIASFEPYQKLFPNPQSQNRAFFLQLYNSTASVLK